MNQPSDLLRRLPAIDRLLQSEPFAPLIDRYGRALALEAARAASDAVRARLLDARPDDIGALTEAIKEHALAQAAAQWLDARLAPTLRPVINASGVVLHTNLGRAP